MQVRLEVLMWQPVVPLRPPEVLPRRQARLPLEATGASAEGVGVSGDTGSAREGEISAGASGAAAGGEFAGGVATSAGGVSGAGIVGSAGSAGFIVNTSISPAIRELADSRSAVALLGCAFKLANTFPRLLEVAVSVACRILQRGKPGLRDIEVGDVFGSRSRKVDDARACSVEVLSSAAMRVESGSSGRGVNSAVKSDPSASLIAPVWPGAAMPLR